MSLVSITQALETAIDGITPAISTAWENIPFAPVQGVEYQQVITLFAEPENPTLGSDFHREQGFVQINLMYPVEQGTIASKLRAEIVRATFKRGNTFVKDGVTVHIDKTPEVTNGYIDADRYKTIIRVYFHANICG